MLVDFVQEISYKTYLLVEQQKHVLHGDLLVIVTFIKCNRLRDPMARLTLRYYILVV